MPACFKLDTVIVPRSVTSIDMVEPGRATQWASIIVIAISMLISRPAIAGPGDELPPFVDFSGIPPASSVCESKARLQDRRHAAIKAWANTGGGFDEYGSLDPLVDWTDWVERSAGLRPAGTAKNAINYQALAKLWMLENVPEPDWYGDWGMLWSPTSVEYAIDDYLVNDANIYALSGSDQHQDQYVFFCHRCGDYDFFTTSLLPIYFMFGDRLSPQARSRIIDGHPSDAPCPNSYCSCDDADSCNHCSNTADDLVFFTGDPGAEQTFSVKCDDYMPCIIANAVLITLFFGPLIWSLDPIAIYTTVASSLLADIVFTPWCKREVSQTFYDSENHVMMQATARYLANMVRGYPNDEFDRWWLYNPSRMDRDTSYTFFNLTDSLREDFREYNAHPYQTYTIMTLHNLYDFAPEGSTTRLAAHINLDYLSERFAMQSTDLRRNVPWRRHADRTILEDPDVFVEDGTPDWYAILAGNYDGMQLGSEIRWDAGATAEAVVAGETTAGKGTLMAALCGYRVPDPVLDVMIDKGSNPYFYAARPMHNTVEIGYFERNFAILAGGTTWDAPDPGLAYGLDSGDFSREKDGMAQSTRVLFTGGGRFREDAGDPDHPEIAYAGFEIYHPDMDDMTKIPFRNEDAAGAFNRVNSTCVFENFACGTEISWGSLLVPCIAATAVVPGTGETWTFFDITGGDDGCPDFGTYAAVLQRGPAYEHFQQGGFMEIVDAGEFASSGAASFESFCTAAMSGIGPAGYRTTRGTLIEFDAFTTDRTRWAILDVTFPDGRHFDPGHLCGLQPAIDVADFQQWPFIYSHRMTTGPSGVVVGRDTNDFIQCADGTGQVLFNSTNRQESLLLSLADPGEPVRLVQSCPVRDVATYAGTDPRMVTLDQSPGRGVGYVSILWSWSSTPTSVDFEFSSPLRTYRTSRAVTHAPGDAPYRTDLVLPEEMRDIPFERLEIVPHPPDSTILSVEAYEYCPPLDPLTGGDCDLDGVRDDFERPDCLDPAMIPGPGRPDTDGDGVIDECDICPAGYNPDQSEFPDIHSWEDTGVSVPGLLCTSPAVHTHPRSVDLDCDDQPNGCDPCPKVPGPVDGTWADLDEDGVPDDYCDNCAGNISNPDQANCDEAYDSGSHLYPGGNPGTYASIDAGNACDPDPCIEVTSVDSSGPGCLSLYVGGGVGSVAETVRATYYGFEEPLGTETSPASRDLLVDHAFCDCSSVPRADDCWLPPPDGYGCGQIEDIEASVNNGPGWHYLELLDELPEHPADIPPDQHRGPIERTFKQYGNAGARRIVWDVLGEQEYTEACDVLGTAYQRCDPFEYYLSFAPRVEEWDDDDRRKVFWPSVPDYPPYEPAYIEEKSCTVLPPSIRRLFPSLDAEKRATIPSRDNGPGPGRFEWPMREVISYWEFTDPPEHVDDAYAAPKASSRVVGMAVHALDSNTGLVEDRFDLQLAGDADIVDTAFFSAVAFSVSGIQHDSVVTSQQLPAGSQHVVLFGGVDRDGYRNDLWLGTIHPSVEDEMPVLHIDMVSPGPDEPAPSPRAGSALFHDRQGNRLVLWGGWDGSGPLHDLWHLDLATLSWTRGEIHGEPPHGLMLFASEFATIPTVTSDGQQDGLAPLTQTLGYIFGGMKADGTYSDSLWMIDLASGWSREVTWNDEGPPGLAGAAMDVDPPSGRLYLFGGFDDSTAHNWLWSMDLTTEKWSLLQVDCTLGMCPHVSGDPAMAVGGHAMVTVVPGRTTDPAIDSYMEPTFGFTGSGEWRGLSELRGYHLAGDCDGDDIPEENHGTLCSNTSEWWSPPGTTRCDSTTRSTYCEQRSTAPVETFSRDVDGLVTFRLDGRILYVIRDERLVSMDVSEPRAPRVIDQMDLGGTGRDLELFDHTAVVAADSGLVFVELDQEGTMTQMRRVSTCGRAVSVAHDSLDAYFLTPMGLGKVSLRSDATVPDSFAILWPRSFGDWDLVPVAVERCEEMSDLAETICSFFSCPADGYRPLVVVHDHLWFPVLLKLFSVDISAATPEIASYVRTPGRIVEMRKDGRYLYTRLAYGCGRVYDLAAPERPLPLIWHDVASWVDGVYYSDGNAFRQNGDAIEIAIGGVP